MQSAAADWVNAGFLMADRMNRLLVGLPFHCDPLNNS